MSDTSDRVGVVVIGRNEGERLRRCLRSVLDRAANVVYVDSGSTDGSVEHASEIGVAVVELDPKSGFTMARGRNTGLAELRRRWSELTYVQFVDGDCELREGWLDRAFEVLEGDPELGVVFGRRRERHPDASVYNRICDIEWDGPLGDCDSCGGDAMMRIAALESVGAYDASLIAGEEPELCVRLRKDGWRVWRADAEMTLHDAALHRFGQWWTRGTRTGYSYAEGVHMHGKSPWQHRVRELRSVVFWGAAVPVGTLLLLLAAAWAPVAGMGWVVLAGLAGVAALYGWLGFRIQRERRSHGDTRAGAWTYAGFTILAKFPQLVGAVRYGRLALRGRRSGLIEYK